MLKQMLLVGAAAVSFPAIAQDQPAAGPADPVAQAEPVTQANPMTQADPLTPVDPATDPVTEPVTQQAPMPGTDANTAPAEGTAATPAQIAQIVDQEFPSYDADANGELDQTEFAAWMKKLRVATEPAVDPESESVKSWIGQAFAAADADKSTSVNKTELTGFLSRGA